jgi:hypothetical protein
MKKLVLVLVVLFAFIANSADYTKSGYQKNDNVYGYYFVGIPDGDSVKIGGGDTLTAIVGSAGTNVKWVDLGPCPSDPADSGTFAIVATDSTTNAAHATVMLACSLFVTLHPTKGHSAVNFLALVSNSVISDSMTSKTAGVYQIPALRGKLGYRFVAKLFTGATSRAVKLKHIFTRRLKP